MTKIGASCWPSTGPKRQRRDVPFGLRWKTMKVLQSETTQEIMLYITLEDNTTGEEIHIATETPAVRLPVHTLESVEPTGPTPKWTQKETLWCDNNNLATRMDKLLKDQHKTMLIQGAQWPCDPKEPPRFLMSVHQGGKPVLIVDAFVDIPFPGETQVQVCVPVSLWQAEGYQQWKGDLMLMDFPFHMNCAMCRKPHPCEGPGAAFSGNTMEKVKRARRFSCMTKAMYKVKCTTCTQKAADKLIQIQRMKGIRNADQKVYGAWSEVAEDLGAPPGRIRQKRSPEVLQQLWGDPSPLWGNSAFVDDSTR